MLELIMPDLEAVIPEDIRPGKPGKKIGRHKCIAKDNTHGAPQGVKTPRVLRDHHATLQEPVL
jgi:hypothetical protein